MNKLFLIILTNTFLAVSFAQAQAPPEQTSCDPAVEEQNKVLARKFYEQVWFSNHPAAVDELVAPEYVIHDIGEAKGFRESANVQKDIAGFFWENGKMSGTIDYQVAECDLVATRWQWKFQPETWWLRLLSGDNQIPIINVFRFKDGKIVEIWNHRHDIDSLWGDIVFFKGLLIGLIPGFILFILCLLLWRKLRKQKRLIKSQAK
jgi:predicted SnoaL-like aldol condensation-catalyzing enzyme